MPDDGAVDKEYDVCVYVCVYVHFCVCEREAKGGILKTIGSTIIK